MQFKALALLVASSVAFAQDAPGSTTVSFRVGTQNPIYGVIEGDCSFFPYNKVPVSEITIIPGTLQDPTCTFYTERGCEGDNYSLQQGEHRFSRDFFVGSFKCNKS
ncbi:hypothetical protein N8T08_006080 [Aspergillus melleus]|uniref:Uncharacterized protein n=1 Tax=Aspergillus melleus TaxID=138277 RepID=A0ACC3B068_9EURO|nr:hypothetical protein N8T08_006080 [Aspergillus melleus]